MTSSSLDVVLDPARGGSIRSVVDRHTGVDVLFQTGWSDGSLPGPARGHEQWVEQWTGGWHALFPNAGEPCEVEGRPHSFHGAASAERWTLDAYSASEAGFSWDDKQGLAIRRRIRVNGSRVNVATVVANSSEIARAFVLVEHIIFASQALGPGFEVTLPPGFLRPLANDGSPLDHEARVARWPLASLDGDLEDWCVRAPFGTSRFGTLHDLPHRHARIDAPSVPLVVHLTWSSSFPYLWYWEEHGGTNDPPWNGRTSCIGIEPAICATSEGLAPAVENRDAVTLAPGQNASFDVQLEIDSGTQMRGTKGDQ